MLAHLTQSHPLATLQNWAARLKYFRFFRAFGGHANDGDSLDVMLSYTTEQDYVSLAETLGITLSRLDLERPKPVPGVQYTSKEFEQFRFEIPEFPTIEQPKFQEIDGTRVYIWCREHKMKISIASSADDGYSVCEADVESAERLELRIDALRDRVIDPPRDTDHYFCPKYYPEHFHVTHAEADEGNPYRFPPGRRSGLE